MMDSADPLGGWEFAEVLSTDNGNAAYDIHGKLFVHVTSLLRSFKQRLLNTGAKFEIYNLNATELPGTLAPTKFARIEV
jgi:hypothetical protein